MARGARSVGKRSVSYENEYVTYEGLHFIAGRVLDQFHAGGGRQGSHPHRCAALTLSDAHRLAASIIESKKILGAIYITHFHPDHYFGLTVLKEAFPEVKMVALPSTVEDIGNTWEAKVKTWKPLYGGNIPSRPVIPEPLAGTELFLEGEPLQIVGEMQGDAMNNSYVWIPSFKAAICGDIVYNGVHPWTMETTSAQRADWLNSLERIAALKPAVVVAGHKRPELRDDPICLEFTRDYLEYYDGALVSSGTAEELREKVKSRFPDLALEVILTMASDAAFPKEKKAA
jgi:glyoxylase-like metal-dependent hydrolase (beta-lactamase superfamily II)